VEAEDYVFSLERILNPKTGSPGQTYFTEILGAQEFADGKAAHVAGLRAPDPRTFVIELAKPAFTFRYVLAMTFATAVPRELVRQYGANFQYHLTGSGPYRLVEWRRGVRWRLERNPHYRGADGWVDAYDIMIGGDYALASMMIQRGEIDRLTTEPVQAQLFQRDARFRDRVHPFDVVSTSYLFLNNEIKPFDDVRVRQAMNHAVNKERLRQLSGGFAAVADGIVPPSMPWTNPDRPLYDYNPDKARALLREAGHPGGFNTEFWYQVDVPGDRRLAESIQNDLHEVGVELTLQPSTTPAFLAKAQSRHQLACGLSSWYQDYPDPSNFLDVLLNGDRITELDCNNHAFYSQPRVSRVLAEANRSVDGAERHRLYALAETEILKDAPWVPLLHRQFAILRTPRVRGDVPHPVWGWCWENMWLAN
jgi:ABC-type transport system substrate-binding protein